MKKSLLIVFLLFYSIVVVNGQSIYRSLTSGNWNASASWQIRTGVNTWATATSTFPTATDTVYIQKGHTIAISAEAACYNLHLDTLGVLNISGAFNVNVNGKIRAFTALAAEVSANDGTYQGTSVTTLKSTMLTTGSTGVLKFVGGTRSITVSGEWGSNSVTHNTEFALNAGAIGTLGTGYKCKKLKISSGIVSTASLIAVSNTATDTCFWVKSGARFVSSTSGNVTNTGNYAIATSSKAKCAIVYIENNGTIEFSGATPVISVTKFINQGTIVYSCPTVQTLLDAIPQNSDVSTPLVKDSLNKYTNVRFINGSTKSAVSDISVSGTFYDSATTTLNMLLYTFGGIPTSVTNNGIILTQSTFATPIPSGFTWGGTVNYSNPAGKQRIVLGSYGNLYISSTSNPDTISAGTIYVADTFKVSKTSSIPNVVIKHITTGNTINFNKLTSGQPIPAFYYNNLVVSSAATAPTPNNYTLAADSIYISGTFNPGSFPNYYAITGNTINFNNPTGGQTIPKFNFNNLVVSNTSAPSNTICVADTIGVAGTFSPGGFATSFTTTGSTFNFNNLTGAQTIPAFNFYNVLFTNPTATTYNTLAGNINVANSLTLAGKKGLKPGVNAVVYAANSSFYFTGTATDTIYNNSPQWPSTSGPTNVTINSLSSTLVLQQSAPADTFMIVGVSQSGNVATVTTSANNNFTVGNTVTLGGLSNSEYGGVFGGIFVVTAASGNTFSFALPTTTITGSVSGTTLTVTNVTSGSIYVGQVITGGGITAGTTITSLLSGTGGIGTYTISSSQTVASTTLTTSFPTVPYTAVIGGVAKSNVIRTVPGTFSLYYGGKISINHGNSLIMSNGSTIYRNDPTATVTLNSGFLSIGTKAQDRVNITIAKTMTSDNEFAYLATPGKYGTLSIFPGATYYPKGSRTITDLDNSGILKLIDTSQTNFNINGNLIGTGTIGGSDSATLILGGNNSGSIGTLSMTPGYQRLFSLKINRIATGASVTIGNRDTIKNELNLTAGSLLDNGNTIVVQGTVSGLSAASHVSSAGGKILMTGSNLSTRCIKGGNFAIGNLEIDPGVGNTIYDSTSFSIANLTLTSGTFLFSDNTNYTTTVLGNILGTGASSGPGKIKMTGTANTISGVSIDSLEIATVANITATANFNVNRGLLLNGNFADGGFVLSNAGIIFGSGTHTGLGRIKMTGVGKSILGNPSLMNIEIGSPSASVTSGFTATINSTLLMNGGAVNIDAGNTLLFKNNTSIVRASGIMTNNGSMLIGATTSDVVNVILNGNLRTTGELPSIYAPGKIDLTINNGFTDTLNNNNKTVRNLFLNNGSLRSLFDSTSRLPYNITVTDTCLVSGNFNIDSSSYSYAGLNNFFVAPMLNILGTFKFGNVNSKTFNANGFMTLKSSETQTANVADITNNLVNSGNAITGNVIVERYISGWRAWRLLSMPTKHNLQTIKEAWQENQATGSTTLSGYGMQISKDSANWNTTGFDYQAGGGPGVKYYSGNVWKGITSTINVPGISNGKFELGKAYMTFFRGDRTVNTYIASQVTVPTILREKGELYTGDLTISVPAGQFVAVGNPYASAIDYTLIERTNVDLGYNLWDPKIGTLGGYQAILGSSCAPCGGSFNNDGSSTTAHPFIESGQGFFVHNSTGVAGSIKMKEQSKKNGSYLVSRNNNQLSQLRTDLYKLNNGNWDLYDGVLQIIDPINSNHVDGNDAMKMSGTSESISLMTNDTSLAIESRSQYSINDTVKFQLAQMKLAGYKLVVEPTNLYLNGLQAYLEDSYLNTSTMIDLSSITNVEFTVTADAGSYNPKRFKIVFRPIAALPVSFISVKATKKGTNESIISWKVEHQMGINKYFIERAEDGVNFSGVGNVNPLNIDANSYQFTDMSLKSGIYYYRIKAQNITGGFCLSEVVKIQIDKKETLLSVSPNPVSAIRAITISLNELPYGNLTIVLYDLSGKKLFSTTINHSSINNEYKLKLPDHLPSGQYQLCTGNENTNHCTSIVLQ